MNSNIFERLQTITDSKNILVDEPMSRHTTFRVGGNADYMVIPNSIEEAADIVRLLLRDNIPYYVIGNGSNLLVSDNGFRGVIVAIGKGMDSISVSGNMIEAQAGAMLSKVSSVACEKGLAGLAFASGIPGSVGGAIVMNAGAYGSEMVNVVKSVTMLDIMSGDIVTLANSDMEFSYRTSLLKRKPAVVLSVVFELSSGDTEAIKLEMMELNAKRRDKQPLEYPSAGSTFKRPEGYFAGKLIEDAGLKGYTVGGAQVSTKHSGFVVNVGNASASDIYKLIGDVSSIVKDKFGVSLEPEVCMLGDM